LDRVRSESEERKKLIDAIASFEEEKIDKSLGKIGKINYQDQRGYIILRWHLAIGDLGIGNSILARSPDQSVTNDEGKTALDIARKNRNESRIRALKRAQRSEKSSGLSLQTRPLVVATLFFLIEPYLDAQNGRKK
jgi:ankyrin repeat protein